MKKCPFCAEQIQDEAIKCRYCGSMLRGGAHAADDREGMSATMKSLLFWFVLIVVGVMVWLLSSRFTP